jgi:hypothetical protein
MHQEYLFSTNLHSQKWNISGCLKRTWQKIQDDRKPLALSLIRSMVHKSVYEAYSWQCVGSLYNGPEQQEQVDQAVDDVSLKKRISIIKKTLFNNCICTFFCPVGFPIRLQLQYCDIQLTTNKANVFINNLTT